MYLTCEQLVWNSWCTCLFPARSTAVSTLHLAFDLKFDYLGVLTFRGSPGIYCTPLPSSSLIHSTAYGEQDIAGRYVPQVNTWATVCKHICPADRTTNWCASFKTRHRHRYERCSLLPGSWTGMSEVPYEVPLTDEDSMRHESLSTEQPPHATRIPRFQQLR